jgi:hypothetical protein
MDPIVIRSAVVRVLFMALFLLLALAATAHAAVPHPEYPEAPRAQVASALLAPRPEDGVLVWRARWVLAEVDATAIADGAGRTLRFAVPLGPADALDRTPGLTPLSENGLVTGVRVERAALDGRIVAAKLRQNLTANAILLGAPVLAGSALQIIDGEVGAGLRLHVAPGVLETFVGYVAPPRVGHPAREEARRLTGYEVRLGGAPIFVRGDDLAGGPLAARLEPVRSGGTVAAVAVVFVLLVGALAVALRRLHRAASLERADALLAAEVDALAPGPATLDDGRLRCGP